MNRRNWTVRPGKSLMSTVETNLICVVEAVELYNVFQFK